ncbi:MAG: hypothetical protein ACK5L3_10355 [Oscillospiraceae bacterium]
MKTAGLLLPFVPENKKSTFIFVLRKQAKIYSEARKKGLFLQRKEIQKGIKRKSAL